MSEVAQFALYGLVGAIAAGLGAAIFGAMRSALDFFARKLAEHALSLAFQSPTAVEQMRTIVGEELDRRPLTNGAGWSAVKRLAEHLGVDLSDIEAAHKEKHPDE